MTLLLTVAAADPAAMPQQSTWSLEHGQVSIGRGQENDWVLPDPQRHISKRHCIVMLDQGQALVHDASLNGVFINNADQPVGRGNTVALQDGDLLRFGGYEIEVRMSAAAGYDDPYGEPAPPYGDQSPHGAPAGGYDEPPPPYDGPDPFATADPYAADPVGAPASPPGAELPSNPYGPTDRYDAAVDQVQRDPGEDADPFGLGPEGAPDDPFITTGPAGQPAGGQPDDPFGEPGSDFVPGAPQSPQAFIPEDADLGFDAPGEDWGTAADADHIATDNISFVPPRAVPETPPTGAIPEDWDVQEPSAAPPGAPSFPPPTAAAPPARPVAAPPPMPGAPPAAGGDEAGTAFMQGAGFGAAPPLNPAIMHAVGAAFRETVQGLCEVLSTRRSIKSEFRIDQTQIRPVENNPLKFSESVDEAMEALLIRPRPGDLPLDQAMRQALNDIVAHQLAVMAGLQVALTNLLRRFDPVALRQRLEQTSMLDSIMPANRKAKYWDLFEELYQQIATEAEDDFHGLFGREFARAYNEQIRRLAQRPPAAAQRPPPRGARPMPPGAGPPQGMPPQGMPPQGVPPQAGAPKGAPRRPPPGARPGPAGPQGPPGPPRRPPGPPRG